MTPAAPGWLHSLRDAGGITDDLAAVFRGLPRRLFLPELIWPFTGGGYVTADRRDDPEAWEAWADTDVAVVTQWDDGAHIGRAPGTTPTSSASMPSVVAGMLTDLGVRPGHRVLDAGAGTGWTTGLLAVRAGAGNVEGREVDDRLAGAARERLRAAGLDAEVHAGDAAEPGGGPYDRVHGTFAVRRVPYAWVERTRPGGVIVVPWGTRYTHLNAVARLTVADDGTASGPFTRNVEFMLDRRQRAAWPSHEEYLPGGEWPPGVRESRTSLPPAELTAAEFAIGALVPDIAATGADGVLMLYGLADRSWAAVYAGESRVFEGGPRSLWHEVEDACRRWAARGRPGAERFGLTLTPNGDRIWLDHPDNVQRPT